MGDLTHDYKERVYAGVLGKVIGVYLGRPFEGWPYEYIQKKLGDIRYYVHEKLNVPLIVTDDDITGTFTFLRALEDHGSSPNLTSREIGQSWLNYLIREKTILWWGGLGNSTEHTAYLRLVNGIDAPRSGSIELNGKVVAEQIGAQIFIDGWAMVSPGNPDQAVRFAEAAARVSHDGEAVYGAKVLTAMESMAFIESDIQKLIDLGLSYIPPESVIARMIADLREWHAKESDWRATRELLSATYGYDKYGGNCHMVPNHGLIIHSLLHGEGDFSETLKIVNTCGWDTDCNSGNVGCLMGILVGIEGIDAGMKKGLDWRGPVADRLYVPTADGERGISDCVREACHIIDMGHALSCEEAFRPKNAAQFHFTFSGSVQGFQVQMGEAEVTNVQLENSRGLRLVGKKSSRIGTPLFIPSKEIGERFEKRGYALLASPRLFPGQILEIGANGNYASIYLAYYGENDEVGHSEMPLEKTGVTTFEVPNLPGPIFELGIVFHQDSTVSLDFVKWSGAPKFVAERPKHKGTMWRKAWVNAVDELVGWSEMFRVIQNDGLGMISQGTQDWQDYKVHADVTPHLAKRAGIAIRTQGLRRFYGLLVTSEGTVQLIRKNHDETVLAEASFHWLFGETLNMSLTAEGDHLTASINGVQVLEANDSSFRGGAAAILIEEGRSATNKVTVEPVS